MSGKYLFLKSGRIEVRGKVEVSLSDIEKRYDTLTA